MIKDNIKFKLYKIQGIFRQKTPRIYGYLKFFYHFILSKRKHKTIFSKYYHNNFWTVKKSVSGEGSDLSQTSVLLTALPLHVKRYSINTLLDIPCGDFNWMKHVNLCYTTYIGADVVPDLIKANIKKYADNHRTFKVMDLTNSNLPKVDLILSRDCLVHFSYKDIFKSFNNIKNSRAKYLLTTTYPNHQKNIDIATGGWRPLNLQAPPFNFPEPIELTKEHCTIPRDADKNLGLWKIKNISVLF